METRSPDFQKNYFIFLEDLANYLLDRGRLGGYSENIVMGLRLVLVLLKK